MKRISLLSLLVAFVLVGVVHASTYNGTVTFTCTTWSAASTGSHVLDRDNTGTGQERITINLYDGAGTLLHTETYQNVLGTYGGGASLGTYDLAAPAYNPLRFVMISPAGNGLPEQVDVDVTGTCAGLPTYAAPNTCGLNIPSGSVVGEAPNGAQIYYAPGGISTVTLNPGTYIVVGQDESETYYKIVLACQFVWVRKDTMQPSYQAPQNGMPLPTRIVS